MISVIEPTQEYIKKIVGDYFEISSVDIGLVKMRFHFEDSDFKAKFVQLTQKLETSNLLCTLEKEGYNQVIIVSKLPKQKKRKWLSKSWTPRLLFVATVVMVLVDGFYRTQGLNLKSYLYCKNS